MQKFVKKVDPEQAASLITDCDYYGLVLSRELAGTEIYGVLEESELVACVVILRSGAQAYLDYLCVHPAHRGTLTARTLLAKVAATLRKQKVLVVHACISGENGAATKLLRRYNAKIGWPYVNAVVKLED